MKSYDELKAEMETIQQQMAEAKKNERTNALKEVKRLCKEFGFTAGMLKGSLAGGMSLRLMGSRCRLLFKKLPILVIGKRAL